MSATFTLRRATAADAPTIARHRALMYREIHALPEELCGQLEAASRRFFEEALATGEYVAWLVAPAERPEEIVGGGGVQLRRIAPTVRERGGRSVVAEAPQAIVRNVYTEPAWRRRGVAGLLIRRAIEWAREEQVTTLVLHASDDGRPLYEKLGFVPTNEMRYSGEL